MLFMDLILPPDSQSSYLQDTSPMLDLILNWAHISVKHRVSFGIISDEISLKRYKYMGKPLEH